MTHSSDPTTPISDTATRHGAPVPSPGELLAAVGLPVSCPPSPTADEVGRLRAVAGGRAAGDVALRGGSVVSVHTGEIITADVILAGRHIAAVVPQGRLEAETVVDVSGHVIAPTYLDAHLHIDYSLLPPGEYARLVVPMGTSGAFADPVCLANVLGLLGLDLTAATRTPLRLFQQVTPDVPRRGGYQLGGAVVPQEAIVDRLRRPHATSIGESNPFLDDREMHELLAAGLAVGKRATGHTARLTDEPLWAYVAGGVFDDHNAATWDEVLDRVRLGMDITLQLSSMSDYTESILGEALRRGPDGLGLIANHISFCADDKHVEDLDEFGHIDHHVRSAVNLGVPPAVALRMASLNAAVHYRVDHLVGSITPGKLADLQLLPDLVGFRPAAVWIDGREVARDGRALFVNDDPVPEQARDTMRVAMPFDRATIAAPATPGPEGTALVRAMEMYDGYYKRAVVAETAVSDGMIVASPEHDLAKIVVVDRHHASGAAGIGFVRGFGLRSGAIAATTNCDNQNIVAVGTSDDEIAAAVEALVELGGGYLVVDHGEVTAALPLPYAGIMSDRPWEEVHRASQEVNAAAAALGCSIHAPFMILAFVGLPGVPDYGLTELGLIDVASQQLVGVVLEDHGAAPDCRCVATSAVAARQHGATGSSPVGPIDEEATR